EIEYDEDEEADSSFVTWFCNARGHEFYCKVDEDFIADKSPNRVIDSIAQNGGTGK
ncbi:MAG: hypothetical protein EBW56_06270, partial [Burkholderiaceae bacterium]|nr:hypothetical protein [Burkholderiaceae bacterium]